MRSEDVLKEGYNNIEEFQQIWMEINGALNPPHIVIVYEFFFVDFAQNR